MTTVGTKRPDMREWAPLSDLMVAIGCPRYKTYDLLFSGSLPVKAERFGTRWYVKRRDLAAPTGD